MVQRSQAFLGMWYIIVYKFHFQLAWTGIIPGYWYITTFLFSFIFPLDREGYRREISFHPWRRRNSSCVFYSFAPTSFSPPPHHFIWGRTSCQFSVWDLAERLSKTLLTITTQGSCDTVLEMARSLGKETTSLFIYSINIWPPTMASTQARSLFSWSWISCGKTHK